MDKSDNSKPQRPRLLIEATTQRVRPYLERTWKVANQPLPVAIISAVVGVVAGVTITLMTQSATVPTPPSATSMVAIGNSSPSSSTTTASAITNSSRPAFRPRETTYLADLEPAREEWDGAWTNAPVTLDGRDYTHGMKAEDDCDDYQEVREYPLSRRYVKFKGIAGFADDSEDTVPTPFKVTADGKTVLSGNIQLGDPIPIDLDVRNVVRLGILVGPTPTDQASCSKEIVAVGDARLER